MSERLLDALKADFREKPEAGLLRSKLREKMRAVFDLIPEAPRPIAKPFVTLLIGVNGAGKTTTAGKLASQAKAEGKKVILGAADTFRAAAVEQLKTWADRIGVECIVPAQGANPAAVAFDAVAAAISRDADELIIDTAGRLHTKENLMDELKKVVRVIQKKIPDAPHRVLLVLDATLGQNALLQAKEFSAAVPATGVVLTKLDGSAKGGAAFAVSADLGLPVAFVGMGETAEDLRPFSAEDFVRNLVPEKTD
jgi:fused signal recognition particle receptor